MSGDNRSLSDYTLDELWAEIRRRERPPRPKGYEPMCPFGYSDCVLDCNYIKYKYPEWHKSLGEPTECQYCNDGSSYDDEDK